ncbi:tyrosine-type recombinase/integrase [Brevundimonas sp. BH3]|uniref:tyrosine-type recombinase/integrase n=1 Tax=Brevundimonas sp. BH3 TaxID=3133089 RepID=UPI003244DD16
MALLPIKGIHIVTARSKTYVYAWRGGPRLHAPMGTPEFFKELAEVTAAHTAPDNRKMLGLVADYQGSDDWKQLADKTRKNWTPFVTSIKEKFGSTSIAAFDRPLIRVVIRKWRDTYKHSPRQADMALQVLSRILSFGVAEGRLQDNACRGIPRLYANNRAQFIWTDADIEEIAKFASPEVMWAVRLGALTGLRKSDLLRLSWSHVQDYSIECRTGKSSYQKTAVIPLYRELKSLLDTIPKRATTILTNQDGKPWKTGFDASYRPSKLKANIDLHFHDLRGTAATRMYMAGLTVREISQMFTWGEDKVERLIDTYVKKDEIMIDRIRRIDALETRTAAVKHAVKQ